MLTLLPALALYSSCAGSTRQLQRDGANYYVVAVAPGASLEAALSAALPCSPGGNVALELGAGTYSISAELRSESGQHLRLFGLGPTQTRIDAQASTRHVYAKGQLEIFDLTLYNGNPISRTPTQPFAT